MNNYDEFKEAVKNAAERFKQIPKDKVVRVVSHFDTDGISSGALIAKMLILDGRRFHLTNMQHVTRKTIEELSLEEYEINIFTDIGSSQLQSMEELLPKNTIFILDHHQPQKQQQIINNKIFHINPIIFGIDGELEVSGSGVSYFFAKAIDPRMIDYAHIAILGAIADQQENEGFFGLNADILSDAVKMGRIGLTQGLRLFGVNTRPLHKVLEFNTDYFIPGVTGNESGALKLLSELSIPTKNSKGEWRKITQLNELETQKLADAIIEKRKGEDHPQNILGNLYLIKSEAIDSPYKDAREYSTIINAAGRLGHTSIGVATCLGDPLAKIDAAKFLGEYHYSLLTAVKWLEEKRGSLNFFQREGYAIINAESEISTGIIGTLSSIVSRSHLIRPNSIIIAMAQKGDGWTKISLRFAGKNNPYNLKDLCKKLTDKLEMAEHGGHRNAAGCVIKTIDEGKFIDNAEHLLEKLSMEEQIN